MEKDVIVALDFPTAEETFRFLQRFGDERPYVKIGMELFYAEGPSIVKTISSLGYHIFLDLKLHDIPNTVRAAMGRLAGLGIDMVNLHASGGIEMMRYAVDGLLSVSGPKPLLIGVTVLTSITQESLRKELGVEELLSNLAIKYAQNAKAAGLDGVVCSAKEANQIHARVGKDFLCVSPGIRFADSQKDDQKRVMSPSDARRMGSDFIVVGRPITRSEDPLVVWERCRTEFLGTSEE